MFRKLVIRGERLRWPREKFSIVLGVDLTVVNVHRLEYRQGVVLVKGLLRNRMINIRLTIHRKKCVHDLTRFSPQSMQVRSN